MTNHRSGQVSSYLKSLPAVYQARESSEPSEPGFLGRFLLGFEEILTGLPDVDKLGLEQKIERATRYFNPNERDGAPVEFLEWLSGWVALSLRADLDERQQRDFIANAASLYRLRGTKKGLERLLKIYTGLLPKIDELNASFQIGVHSTIGEDTILGGGPAFFFRVILNVTETDPARLQHYRSVARAIIDAEKPAFTHYALELVTVTMQISERSTIGVDTLLSRSAY